MSPRADMEEAAARAMFKLMVAHAGGQRAFARQHKFSAAYVNDVVLGRRKLSERVLKILGLKEIVTPVKYRRIR